MSNYPYAFPKTFILNGTVATTGTSGALTAGQFGLFDKNTNAVVTTSNVATYPYVYAAQGSFYTIDKLANTPLGRLKESRKTQGINAKYVSKFYKKVSVAPANHILKIGGTASALAFEADKTYHLRVEFKGSPALRVLNRHLYKHVPFFTGCASGDCLTGCDKEYVDPGVVMKGWADYINADPLLSTMSIATPYVQAAATTVSSDTDADVTVVVASATGIVVGQLVQGAGIKPNTFVTNIAGTTITLSKATGVLTTSQAITFNTVIDDSYSAAANDTTPSAKVVFLVISAGYTDSTFNDCSFNPYDFVQVEPLIIYASLVDEIGNPCESGPKINSNVNQNTTEIQAPVQPQGIGETVLRDLLLSMEYDGIHFSTDPRVREIEKNPALDAVDRTSTYTRYYLQFHVPTHVMPTNTMGSNQYLVCFAFESSIDTSAFETLITTWLAANNPTVSLQTL